MEKLYAYGFFGVLIVVSLLECVVPRRQAGDTLRPRWFGNISLYVVSAALVSLAFPLARLGWAVLCRERGWGLFNNVSVPAWLAVVVTVLLLDAVTYTQHYVLHHVPLLWRMHRTHHTDHDFDFTTAVRFHPLEAVFGTAILLAAIAALGAPPAGVFVSQLLSMLLTFIEHGNVRLPAALDRTLRLLVVTPDMHRIHHSAAVEETNSNFGTVFPWWDRVFGTYVDEPAGGQDGVTFGLAEFHDRKHLSVHWMLAQPFLGADRLRPSETRLADREANAPL